MKRQTAAVLLSLLAASLLAACGTADPADTPDTAPNTDSAVSSSETADTVTKVDPRYTDAIGSYDFGGEDFNFLLCGDGDPYNWSEIDVLSEGETGETINDGIYARNLALEERLNIRITGIFDMNAASVLNKTVSAGDDTYDAAWLMLSSAGPTAQTGSVFDWHDVPHIDLSKAYWDQSIIRDLSVGGKVYYLTGDISTIDNQATWIMMFNKSMVNDYDMEDPYTLVREGRWTIDKFSEMTRDIARDLNGDGIFDIHDMYGLSTTTDTIYGLFYSAGLSFISKDSDDLPYFNLDLTKAQSVLERTAAIFNEDNRALIASRITGQTSNVITGIREAFLEGRALFYAEVMFHVANLRQMETDFGIIPQPKYDEAQEDYITFVNPAGSCLTVPITVASVERSGIVLEAMASESYRYLTPAYYNTALQQKYTRDNESAEMLDLLLQNRVYDLAMIYSWGNINAEYRSLADNNKTDLASVVAKREKQIDKGIEKFLAAFES